MIRNRHHAHLAIALGLTWLMHPQTRRSCFRMPNTIDANRDIAHALLFQAGVSVRDLDEDAVRRGMVAMKKGKRR